MPALQSCGTVCTYACPCGARKSVFYRIWLSMTGFSITIGDEHFASHTLIISFLTALACDSEASDSSDWQCTLRFIVLMSCNRLQSPAAGKKTLSSSTMSDSAFRHVPSGVTTENGGILGAESMVTLGRAGNDGGGLQSWHQRRSRT